MTISETSSVPVEERPRKLGDWLETASFTMLLIILAWSPFPLGSNRPWSWSLLAFGVGIAWTLWMFAAWIDPQNYLKRLRLLWIPILLVSGALLWAFVQTLEIVPEGWKHPFWSLAAAELPGSGRGSISLNPWATLESIMRLCSYAAALVLTVVLCVRSARAHFMLRALIVIGTAYAIYAGVFSALDLRQVEIFYDAPRFGSMVAAPFVLHNSFATYVGLAMLCACVGLFSSGAHSVAAGHGVRQTIITLVNFITGRGLLLILALLILFVMLVASGSRAGFIAALVGLLALSLLAIPLARKRSTMGLAVLGAAFLILVGGVLFANGGANLESEFNALVEAGGTDPVRLTLWDAAERMIHDAPLLGLGLNTFLDAYPLYAQETHRYIMDRAHNDYLELAAGLGLPGALALWGAILWLTVLCIRGVFTRRRNRFYPLLGAAATVLVAVHSAFDFSLQIPAVAFFYAVILGLGVAQSFSTRDA